MLMFGGYVVNDNDVDFFCCCSFQNFRGHTRMLCEIHLQQQHNNIN